MHVTVNRWLRDLWHSRPELFHGKRVLELGARALGGSAAVVFADCDYTGLDAAPGPGVDVVSLAHEYEPDAPFDVVVCISMLEHDPFHLQTLACLPALVRSGGTLLLTFPVRDWPAHELDCSPRPGYYANPNEVGVLGTLARHFTLEVGRHDREVFVVAERQANG